MYKISTIFGLTQNFQLCCELTDGYDDDDDGYGDRYVERS